MQTMKNKRGIVPLVLIVLIFTAFGLMVVLGIQSFTFGVVDDSLSSLNFELGNTTWNDTYEENLKPGIIAAETTVPKIVSGGTLLGMIFLMLLTAYHSTPKGNLWILVDIGIIIVMEFLAVVISERFLLVTNLTPEFLDVFSNTLSLGSKFVINLPIIVPIVGAIIILGTYVLNKVWGEAPTTQEF